MSDNELGSNIEQKPITVQKPKRATGMPGYTKILLEENDDIPPTGLFVAVNGRSYLIQTGVPVDVPREVISVLETAVMSMPTVDPATRQVVGYRERMRYPFRFVREAGQ